MCRKNVADDSAVGLKNQNPNKYNDEGQGWSPFLGTSALRFAMHVQKRSGGPFFSYQVHMNFRSQ